MSDGVQFEVNADALFSRLNDPRLLADALDPAMEAARQVAQKTAEGSLDGGTGIAVRTLFSSADPMSMKMGTMLPRDRAMSIEQGRSAGVPARSILPQIINWREAVGAPDPAIEIALEIEARGTRAKKFMERTREAVRQVLPRLMKEAGSRMEARWK